jgi:hypothetical protein
MRSEMTIEDARAAQLSYAARGYFIEAGWFWGWVLKVLGIYGITMPWGVYLLSAWHENDQIRFHEAVHLAQMERDGVLPFYARYAWQWLRRGYWEIPYEQEALELECERYGQVL